MDFQTIIIILAIVLAIAYLVRRNQSTANNNSGHGSERPSYDDPNIQGRGSFGRNRGNQSQSDKPSKSSNSDALQPSLHNDDPNIRGRGSFGRDKP